MFSAIWDFISLTNHEQNKVLKMVKSVTTVRTGARTVTTARDRLLNMVVNGHWHCIGLNVEGTTLRTYMRLLLKHLIQLSRPSEASPGYRVRARALLLSLGLSSLMVVTSGGYGAYLIFSKIYSLYRKSQDRPYGRSLVRTKSQTDLRNGARIMYIPEDVFQDRKEGEVQDVEARKKIYIPRRDDDVYEHDQYLFKNVEQGRAKNSQLFYSRFMNQMNVLSKILIPSLMDKNAMLLGLQIFFLVMRTWLSLFVARLDGQIVRDIIAGRGRRFLLDLACWFLIALPASYTNSAIKLLQRKLSLNFRVYLTRYIHDIYLDKRLAFYKLIFDDRASSSVIKNIDNSISNDVARFCDATCSVFANIAKPVIDLCFFSVYLRDNLGTLGVAGIFVNYFITGYLLKKFTPPLGKLASSRSTADGNYYNYHVNMINNNEEIAFYQGTEVEKAKVMELYDILMDKILAVDKSKFNYNMLEDYILKYTWSGLGYVFASIPIVVTTLSTGVNIEDANMKEFIVNKRLMLSLADAGSRLMQSIKDISQLTGYTNRIFTLLCSLHKVHSSKFSYGATGPPPTLTTDVSARKDASQIDVKREIVQGTVQRNFNGVRFENIDVIIPSVRAGEGIKLIKKLTFQVPPQIEPTSSAANSVQDLKKMFDVSLPFFEGPGASLLILGPNSCGKSSIQRIIAEIWPVYNKNGLLSIPSEGNLFCVPQKPYFTRGGTLRDQIIYPMSSDEFFDRGFKDKHLVQILGEVRLEYLLKRKKGWTYLDAVADWKDVLSGGEKQRMNFARIMFHKPRFVVLDEGTNAISADMEDYLFNLLKRYRFNFISISQRPSLIKYHDLLLEITDTTAGSWQLQALGTAEAITSIDHEIDELSKKMANVAKWELEREELQGKLAII